MNKLILGFVLGCAVGAVVVMYWGYPAVVSAVEEAGWAQTPLPITVEETEPAAELLPQRALYNQRELLDNQTGALLAGRPGQVDLYFLGIGGDGSQGVFRREVEFVRDQFDHRFGTQGRSLTLINSGVSAETTPLATTTSIRAALAAIAARMNPDEDVLFVFLTSHGSEDHQLLLNQGGVDLRSLSATQLAAMLAELPLRWKVVVISACYSGGFIPALAHDDTLVITAAAADRTSFGCTDLADFTYFGEAYFKQALADTDDFAAAFDAARITVGARELSEGIVGDETSQPQIHRPQPLLAQLQRWREQRLP